MNQFCPRCGYLLPIEAALEFARTSLLCRGCGVTPEEPPALLAPSAFEEEQVAYDLSEWPPEDRTIATGDLVELGIRYRWEESLVLVVPTEAEAQVDALLDEIDENAEAEGVGIALEPYEDDDDGVDGGEEAATAMSDLFIAADALTHEGYDEEQVVEFMEAAAAVGQVLPPYGVEQLVWQRVQSESAAIVTSIEKAEDRLDHILPAAQSLRELLRHYV